MPIPASAEDGELDVRFELRARVEAIDGQFRPNTSPDDIALLLRSDLFAEYDAGPLRIGGELLDSRAYFQRRGSSIGTTEVNALEPIQAYVATDLSPHARVQAGRFTLDLGSRRLLARNAFRNTINVYSGVNALIGDAKTVRARLFWMIAPTRLPADAQGIRDDAVEFDRERGSPRVFGAFLDRQRDGVEGNAYLFRLVENDQPGIATRDRHLWTIGARRYRAPKRGQWDSDVEGAVQWGNARITTASTDLRDRRVRAAFVHASIGHTFDIAWQPRVRFAIDAASGDGNGDRYTRFDTLFGARAFDFGPTSLYGAIGRANLRSVEARFETKPDARTDTLLALRPLWLDSLSDAFAQTGVRDATGRSGRYAGVQIDGRVRRTMIPDRLRVAVGATYLAKGRFLDTAPNAPETGDTRYGYLEMTTMF